MYNRDRQYICPYSDYMSVNRNYNPYNSIPCPYCHDMQMNYPNNPMQYYGMNSPHYDNNYSGPIKIKDYGPEPYVVNIREATLQNDTFRTALWTGKHLQLTLMSLNPGEDIGLEVHPDVDQFLRIEQGMGVTKMGDSREKLDFEKTVYDDDVIFIPAGKWHNLINTGNVPLKLYSIYAPPNHPHGTVHLTKREAMAAEKHHNG